MVRRDGVLQECSWEMAMDTAVAGLQSALQRNGPDAVGIFSCSKSTNEMNYAAQKFARLALGTNNIDSCNRT